MRSNENAYQCFLGEHQRGSEKPVSLRVTADPPVPLEVFQFCFRIHPDTTDFSYCPCPKVPKAANVT